MPRSGKPFRIAMIPGSTDGVNYYRLAAWAFEMRKYRNVIVDLLWFKYNIDPTRPHPWQEDFKSYAPSHDQPGMTVGQYIRAAIDHACDLADVVIWHPVYYDYLLDFFLEMQHKHQKPFLVEVDDNYVDVPPWNEAYYSFQSGTQYRRVSLDAMRNADGLIVTTPHLKQTYSTFNDTIHVVENSLDFKGDRRFVGWDNVSIRKHRGIRIGWIGGRCHFDDLMMVAPVLKETLIKYPQVSLVLVNSALKLSCDAKKIPFPFEGMKNVHYADRSVPINRYAAFAASFGFDIGLAPLVDCNFNRSKSNLRWLEMSALGIPTVASHVGHYVQTVKNGQDGFLCKGLDDWSQILWSLIEINSLREEVGRQAGKRVRKDFNIKRNAPKYVRLLKAMIDKPVVYEDEPEEVLQ